MILVRCVVYNSCYRKSLFMKCVNAPRLWLIANKQLRLDEVYYWLRKHLEGKLSGRFLASEIGLAMNSDARYLYFPSFFYEFL